MTEKITGNDGKVYEVKKPWYKKAIGILLIAILTIILFILIALGFGGYKLYQMVNEPIPTQTTASSSKNNSNTAASNSKSSDNAVDAAEFNDLMSAFDSLNNNIKSTRTKVSSMTEDQKQNAEIDLLQEQNELTARLNDLKGDMSALQYTKINNKAVDTMQELDKLTKELK